MKKRLFLVGIWFLVLFSAACGNAAPSQPTPAAPSPAAEPAPAATEAEGLAGAVDVDLTQLSSTMVYSEVYNMLYEPEPYIGKTVRMQGLLSTAVNPETGTLYFGCLVPDATACCAQGMEFVLAG